MKKLILFSIITFSGFLFGQNLDAIKKTVQQINQTKSFKIKTVPYAYFMDRSEVTDNGIELKGYYKNGTLKKIEHFIGLSAWNVITEYFFSENNTLVFVHSKKYQTLDQNGYLKKPQLLSEKRCYYENNRLIKTIGKFNDDKIDYLKESQKLSNDLKNSKQ